MERTINAAIVNSGWKSPAATRFQDDWNTRYVKTLRQLQKALEALGDAANKMAANYDATEAAYKGAG